WFRQNKLTLRFQSGSEESGSDLVTPHTGTATDIRDTTVTIRAAITAITGVLHITDRITTPDGRTTTAAIEFTSIIGITITATKAWGSCEGGLAWSNYKPAFFSKHEISLSFLAALAEKIL